MMERGRKEELLSKDLLPKNLEEYRKGLHDKDDADDRKQKRAVRQHRDNPERDAKRHRSRVSQKEAGWMNVKPEKRQKRPNDDAAKNGKVILPLGKRDDRVRSEGRHKRPAGKAI